MGSRIGFLKDKNQVQQYEGAMCPIEAQQEKGGEWCALFR